MLISFIPLWYITGYLFYLVFMGCIWDHILPRDAKIGLIMAVLGPVWALIVVIWSIIDTFNNN